MLAIVLPAVASAQERIKTVSPQQFDQLMDSLDAYQLVDVRTRSEFKTGHIRGATLHDINRKSFSRRVDRLDRNQPVLLYCRTGKRSHRAALLLQEMGFHQIIDLGEGITGWKAAGYDIQHRQ